MPLNVGLIGLKGHQGVILSGVQAMPDARLAAVCDDDPAALGGVSGWPSADADTRTFTDPAQMLDEVELDIVGICGHDAERAEMIVAAAERGVHVIAEKPLAKELDELERVRDAVKASGIELSMLLTMRFEPAYRTMRRVVEEGGVGEVCLATMQKSYRLGDRPQWQRDRATFSGIIPFIGIHALDLIRWTTGREFVEGYAYCANTGHPDMRDMEDQATVAVLLDNGGSASARLDYCRPATAPTHGDDRLRIAGSQGVLESMEHGERVVLMTEEEGPRELELDDKLDQFADFVGSMRGESPSGVPAEDCFRMTEICLRLRDAAGGGAAADLR
jgi:predicted dehydrogenase